MFNEKYLNIRKQLITDPKLNNNIKFKTELEDRLPDIKHTIQILKTEYTKKMKREKELESNLKYFSYFKPKTQQAYNQSDKDTSRILAVIHRLEECQKQIRTLIPIYNKETNQSPNETIPPSESTTSGGKRKTRRNRKSKKSKKRKSYKKRI